MLTEGWVTVRQAATGRYTEDYVRKLAREGKVRAHKLADVWIVHEGDVMAHKMKMDALGTAKHAPKN